jgi:hypothetical protein
MGTSCYVSVATAMPGNLSFVTRSSDVRLLEEAGLEMQFQRPNLGCRVCVFYRRECQEMAADSDSGS